MKYIQFADRFVIRLMKGEEILASLAEFAGQHGIEAAVLSGIGAVDHITLGYFDPEKRDYIREEFPDSHELASMNGNLSLLDGKPTLHVHATLADRQHRPLAGHMFSARVSVTVEVVLTRLPGKMERKWEQEIGLNLLQLPS
jgi:predicted DNA-binding protein with PD1-like motif